MFKKIRAKKSLGQNFLQNKSKLRKIAEALDVKPGDIIIEIGPGHGELTEEIRNKNKETRITAIEKDAELAMLLKEKFFKDKNIEILEGDALKILPELSRRFKLKAEDYKIAGNIPYYITGYLLRIIGELKNKPLLAILTIQKEVAQRIAAKPPKMNLLAASVQFWAEPKIIDSISRKDFKPAPKVDSAIIKLQTANGKWQITGDKYYQLIKILFKQPRKTILNNFCGAEKLGVNECRGKLLKAGIDPSGRPQDLTLEQIKNL